MYIPNFLIQPFVENAIRHGLLPKFGYKQLSLSFKLVDKKTLLCTVDDNGVGRKYRSPEKEKERQTRSLGVSFVEQRLLVFSKLYQADYNLKITDKLTETGDAGGTLVTIRIPILTN